MSRFISALGAISLCLLVTHEAAAAPRGAAKTPPWSESFNPDVNAIIAAASTIAAPDEEVIVFLRESRYRFDEAGRRTVTERWVYKINAASAVSDWDGVSAPWQPWHQEKPEIRARVIDAAGRAHELDPKTIDDAPARDDGSDVYTDARVLQGPLPAVAEGSIIEEEVVTRDREPFFPDGTSEVVFFQQPARTETSRLIIEYPAGLTLKYQSRIPNHAEPRRETKNGITRLIFEASPAPKVESYEPYAPRTTYQLPYVSFSTGTSWNQIATSYAAIVDRQIAGSDFRADVKKVIGTTTDRKKVAEKLLAELHRVVRYTGVEFGEASIVPRTPAETLARKYGDCKDQAAMLTAMLRAAGLPAHVALLRVNTAFDVEPELPGFGLFNHAIVVIKGEPMIWIDPTDEFARAGELPVVDQGRLALIADREATALVTTPKDPSTANRLVVSREFRMRELGKSRITETITASGSIERQLRAYYSGDAKTVREALEEYVKGQFVADALTRYSMTPVKDVSRPFEVRLEIDEGARGEASMIDAAVGLFPTGLLERLPYPLLGEEEEGEEEPKPRQYDFIVDEPHAIDWHYTIHPPVGFEVSALPDDIDIEFGPVKLTGRYAQRDGIITADFHFDSGRDRLTPAEFEEARTKIAAFLEQGATLISLAPTGQIHLDAGRLKEAVAEFRRLVALHPKEALHRSQLAMALLAAGFGDRAREEARRAIQLEPKLGAAHRTLGWILQHDSLGRRLRPGYDRAGAIAAYRRAKELDSKDGVARADLAILLEHDSRGVRYSKEASLKEAIDEYLALRKDLDEQSMNDNLAIAMVRAGEFARLREIAKELPESTTKSVCLVVASARLAGTKAAVDTATKIVSSAEQRRAVLAGASVQLMQMRAYPEAIAMLQESAKGAPNASETASRLALFRNMKKHEELTFAVDDPSSVVKRLFVSIFSNPDFDAKAAAPFFVKRLRPSLEGEGAEIMREQAKMGMLVGDQETSVVLDLILSAMKTQFEGEEKVGYRVTATADFAASDERDALYVVKEDGEFRVAAADRMRMSMGNEVIARLDRGEIEEARTWLDWARESVTADSDDNPFAQPPIARLWKVGNGGSVDEMRLAAAALIVDGDSEEASESEQADIAKAIATLRAARAAQTPERQTAIDLAIARGYERLGKSSEVIPVAEALLASRPDSAAAFELLHRALVSQRSFAAAEKRAHERLRTVPRDVSALRALADVAEAGGDYERAIGYLRQLIDAGKAEARDYSSAAWLHLFTAGSEQAVENALRAVSITGQKDEFALMTQAAVFAEVGKLREAREAILTAMDLGGREQPDAADWYVLGRLAEGIDEKATAVAAYKNAQNASAQNSAKLAKGRLQAISGKR